MTMMEGTVFEETYDVFLTKLRERGTVELDDVVKLTALMRSFEMDVHVAICGQNGVGKTYLLLMLLKKAIGKQFISNLLLAKHTTNDLVRFILENRDTTLGIDELNQYFHYQRHAENEQKHLLTTIELARSNRIAIAGCARDPRKLALNYRQGKLSIVIWILDRFSKGGSYAMVFVGNPSIESYDKFGFSMIAGDIVSIADAREMFEELPSFIGYMRVDDATKHLTKDEIENYKFEKQKAMAYAHFNFIIKQVRTRKLAKAEAIEEVQAMTATFSKSEIKEMIDKINLANKRKQEAEDDAN